jgi:AraC-like DNA-binding protein
MLFWKNIRFRGLAYLLILCVFSMAFNLLEKTTSSRNWYLITPIFQLGKGAFFYLFVYKLVYPNVRTKTQYLWHSLPMLVALPLTSWPQLVIGLGTVSQLLYFYFTMRLILKYHKATFYNRSDAVTLQLNWVVHVLCAFLVLGLLDLIRLNLQPYISLTINLNGQLIENTTALFLYSFLIFKAVQHPNLFDGLARFESNQLTKVGSDEDYDKSLLQKIYADLNEIINSRSLHHKPRLSLNDLANETGLNSREISRAINVIGKQSFCDYINRLRIADVKHELQNSEPKEKINFLNLSFRFGFNSKSSFNSVFKREVGMTPSQYLKSLPKNTILQERN